MSVMTNSAAKPEKHDLTGRLPATGWAGRWLAQTSTRYWVGLAVLLVASLALKYLVNWAGWVLRKEAVPLKVSLHALDDRDWGPRYELNREMTDKIPPLSEDSIESLGTQEYAQVYVTDRTKPPHDPTRHALLFITYYTGKPDLVPHVPQECYLAGGYRKLSEETVELPVTGVGAPGDRLPVCVLEFEAPRRYTLGGLGGNATVMYFFHVNGGYATTRNEVRASMANPLLRHAYYAKIEVTFTNGAAVRADKQASVAALGPLLERVLPGLLNRHFDLSHFADAARPAEKRRQ